MAIFHFTVKAISRAKGQSAVASAAYRRAEKLYDQRLGQNQDYTKKQNVLCSELTAPHDAPAWLQKLSELHATNPRAAAEQFWNLVESFEKRQDAQVAREVEFALPLELEQNQAISLAREFIHDQFVLCGMVADWSVHWEDGNPHVHVLLTQRVLTETGFGKKNRDWNSKILLNTWREKWAEYANFHLHMHQHAVRIDHRSYQDQGIDLVPTVHQGSAVNDMHRRGIATDIMQEANSVKKENLSRIAHNPTILLKKLSLQAEVFSMAHISQSLRTYMEDVGKFGTAKKIVNGKIRLSEIEKILHRLIRHDAVFSEQDIARAVSHHTANAELFARALVQVQQCSELLPLGTGSDGKERFTTRQIFTLENQLQQMTDKLRKQHHVRYRQSRINKLLAQYQIQNTKILTTEQRHVVHYLVQPQSITCLVGKAGTGKSFALGAAKHIWEAEGLRVHGIALSGIAADGLTQSAGISSRTIASFQYALANGQLQLNKNDVVVMDEAGMTDTPNMHSVLAEVKKAQAKLVLVGDPNQLQPIGPGASFRSILERTGFVELNTIYRQQQPWQRQATQDLAAGKIPKALHAYAEKEQVHLQPTEAHAMQHLVEDWLKIQNQPNANLQESLILAHRNDDVQTLNQLVRKARVAQQDIAEGYTTQTVKGEIKIAKGERIMFLKNGRQLGVSNGRFATIQEVQFTDTGRLTQFAVVLDGTNRTITIDPNQYRDFTYGYAATIHKAQGVTVDHSQIYVAGKFWNKHLTYVAMSRHRHSCQLYASKENYPSLQQMQQELGKAATKDSVWDYPLAFAARRNVDTRFIAEKCRQHLATKLISLNKQIKTRWQSLQLHQPKTQASSVKLEPKYQAAVDQFYQLQEKCKQSKGQRNHIYYQNQLEKHMEKITRNKALFSQLQRHSPKLVKSIQRNTLEQDREL